MFLKSVHLHPLFIFCEFYIIVTANVCYSVNQCCSELLKPFFFFFSIVNEPTERVMDFIFFNFFYIYIPGEPLGSQR